MIALHKMAEVFCSFPCPGCGNALEQGTEPNSLCKECREKIRFMTPPFCPGCGGELDGALAVCSKCMREEKRLWPEAVALYGMEGLGRILLHRFKFYNTPELARPLARLAADSLKKAGTEFDVVVPVPLHWTRRFMRGFNQSYLMASLIAEFTGKPCEKMLQRVRMGRVQSRLTREERKKNLLDAFSLKKGANCRNRAILVVDDVMTTGSTLSAASAELLKAGASSVNVFVLARR